VIPPVGGWYAAWHAGMPLPALPDDAPDWDEIMRDEHDQRERAQ
jgi:hypothetical protein